MELLSKEHTILERPLMEFRPFGVDEHGEKIRDVTGMIVRANVEYLEDCISRKAGTEGGKHAVDELCRLLNERIRDPVYHVSPALLTNVWNSYRYEFAAFLREFCKEFSGDPNFHFNVGKKANAPLFQAFGRPFSASQIYKMLPYFANKFAKGVECRVVQIEEGFAVLRVKFSDRVREQWGPYLKACAVQTCEFTKGGLTSIPERLHHLPPANVKDRTCMVNGDEWCEWEVTWPPQSRHGFFRKWGQLLGGGGTMRTGVDARLEEFHEISGEPARKIVEPPQQGLLSKDHTILEREFMEFRPFGANEYGEKIRDVSGVIVRANVEYLEEYVARTASRVAGEQAVQKLCRLLNERIRDPAYHVTPSFLKNPWNSYCYEFVCFLREFSRILSRDPDYQFNVGKEKYISPLTQIFARPFSVPQIYRMIPHFIQKYVK